MPILFWVQIVNILNFFFLPGGEILEKIGFGGKIIEFMGRFFTGTLKPLEMAFYKFYCINN